MVSAEHKKKAKKKSRGNKGRDESQEKTNEAQANPTPEREEASKKGDDFYDAEEHTYSVVNVKHKKEAKMSEDDKGE